MYVYFNENGTLKEWINDEGIRRGNSVINKIYVYYDGALANVTGLTVKYNLPNGTDTQTYSLAATTTTAQIPYDRLRDLKFFEYNKNYSFFVITVPDEVFVVAGSVLCSISLGLTGGGIKYLTEIAFNVEHEVYNIERDVNINAAQWAALIRKWTTIKEVYVTNDISGVDPDDYEDNTVFIDISDFELWKVNGSSLDNFQLTQDVLTVKNDYNNIATLLGDIRTNGYDTFVATADEKVYLSIHDANEDKTLIIGNEKIYVYRTNVLHNTVDLTNLAKATDLTSVSSRLQIVELALPNKLSKADTTLNIVYDDATFKIKFQLLESGNVVATSNEIDLPLESVIVSGSYDSENKKIILVLQNGNTIEIPVSGLISGLENSSNKVTSITSSSNNTQYPSAKAVYDFITESSEYSHYYTKTQSDNRYEKNNTFYTVNILRNESTGYPEIVDAILDWEGVDPADVRDLTSISQIYSQEKTNLYRIPFSNDGDLAYLINFEYNSVTNIATGKFIHYPSGRIVNISTVDNEIVISYENIGSGRWGSISGSISDQTDLMSIFEIVRLG